MAEWRPRVVVRGVMGSWWIVVGRSNGRKREGGMVSGEAGYMHGRVEGKGDTVQKNRITGFLAELAG